MIDYVNPKSLIPHEDVELDNLNKVIESLKKDKAIQPVIVDENNWLILDGHHRVMASIMLGLRKIPVYFVNYFDKRIKVNSFALNVKNVPIQFNIFELDKKDLYCLSISSSDVLCSDSLYKLYWKIHFLQSYLKSLGFTVIKTEKDGILLPTLNKEYVIDIAKRGLRFPPRTTRHTYEFIIPRDRISVNEFL